MSLTSLVHRMNQTIVKELDAAASPLTAPQILALEAVSDKDGCSQTHIVAVTGIDRSTVADIVRRLARAGLLTRKRSKEDARNMVLRITDAGSRALAKALKCRRTAEAKAAEQFPILRGLAA